MFTYLKANKTAGYSGFVCYHRNNRRYNDSVWIIPGTFFDDWDNQFETILSEEMFIKAG